MLISKWFCPKFFRFFFFFGMMPIKFVVKCCTSWYKYLYDGPGQAPEEANRSKMKENGEKLIKWSNQKWQILKNCIHFVTVNSTIKKWKQWIEWVRLAKREQTAIQSSWKMNCIIIIKLPFWITCMDMHWKLIINKLI